MNVYRLRPRATTLRVANGPDLLRPPGLPLAVLSLLVSMPGVASAEAFLPPMGGGGGAQFIEHCSGSQSTPQDEIIGGPSPSHQVDKLFTPQNLAGFELRAGDDIDAIRPLCVSAYSTGSVTAPKLTPFPGFLDKDTNRPASSGFVKLPPGWHGGIGGHLTRVVCPDDRPIVVAMYVAAEGVNTVTVNSIHLYCGLAVHSQQLDENPSAIFDAPKASGSQAVLGIGGTTVSNGAAFQRCPEGQVAVGVHGRSGEWVDAIGLICDAPRIIEAVALGRVESSDPPDPTRTICDYAKSARARNSPAAPGLEAQCRAQQPPGKALGRVKSAEPTGAPVPICDVAGSARDRNSPAAPGLEKQCLALGGHLAGTVNIEDLAARGVAIANDDPMLAELRNQQPDGPMRHGFDIGTAAAEGDTAWGPGKQKVLDSLPLSEQEGFKVASSFALDRNRNAELAAIGAAIDTADPILAEARGAEVDVRYWLGFDIATGLFGDPALGAKGNTATGPGSLGIRTALGAPAQRGFNAASALHLSRHY